MNTGGKILVNDDEPESRGMLENWLREPVTRLCTPMSSRTRPGHES